jgi:hypothetical protein
VDRLLTCLIVTGPYQPKVGDKIIGNAKPGGEAGVTNVMEFLCELDTGLLSGRSLR